MKLFQYLVNPAQSVTLYLSLLYLWISIRRTIKGKDYCDDYLFLKIKHISIPKCHHQRAVRMVYTINPLVQEFSFKL